MSAVSDAIHPIETGLRPYADADAERAQRAVHAARMLRTMDPEERRRWRNAAD